MAWIALFLTSPESHDSESGIGDVNEERCEIPEVTLAVEERKVKKKNDAFCDMRILWHLIFS